MMKSPSDYVSTSPSFFAQMTKARFRIVWTYENGEYVHWVVGLNSKACFQIRNFLKEV